MSLKRLWIAVTISGLVILLELISAFHFIEHYFLDLSLKIRGSEQPNPVIAIIEIDDESILRMGQWPWPREYHRDLLELISAAKPKVIFYDVLFSEASNPESDQAFSTSLQSAGNVVLPFYFLTDDPNSFNSNNTVFPIPILKESAKSIGFVNIVTDWDGHVRKMVTRGAGFDHASSAIIGLYSTARQYPDELWINFPGRYEFFRRISFVKLIEEYESSEVQTFMKQLEGKIVLIGYTAAGTGMDLKPTVFSPQYPGVGVQASMIHTFLSDRFIRELPQILNWVLLFCFAFLVLSFGALSPFKSLCLTSLSLAFVFIVCQIIFYMRLIWIPFFGFLFEGVLLYMISTFMQYIRIRLEREMISRELDLAASIQKNMLPSQMVDIPGLDLAALSFPARQVGGDLYDVCFPESEMPGICIGDVSGKGVPAALLMAKAMSEFRRESYRKSSAAILNALNQKLCTESLGGLFLTFFCLWIDVSKKELIYANAGHEPMFILKPASRTVSLVSDVAGPPLAVDLNYVYQERRLPYQAGDIFLLISDGVKEAQNRKKEFFGTERIQSVLLSAADQTSQQIVAQMHGEIAQFVQDTPQHDDLTMVCLKIMDSR